MLVSVTTSATDIHPLSSLTHTPAPVLHVNRGAARQMYGSGSLRAPGQPPHGLQFQMGNRTVYVGREEHVSGRPRQRLPSPDEPVWPAMMGIFTQHDLDKMPQGYPIQLIPSGEIIGVESRNGNRRRMYVSIIFLCYYCIVFILIQTFSLVKIDINSFKLRNNSRGDEN